jgi:hypothetical protein
MVEVALFEPCGLIGNHRRQGHYSQGQETMNKPGIMTAIPRRRYRYGEFTVVVLDDIDSSDGIDYRYIMAVVKGEDTEPGLYVTAEKAGGTGKYSDYAMRILMRDGSEVIATSPAWGELEAFVLEGLEIVGEVLDLSDEVPYQLR